MFGFSRPRAGEISLDGDLAPPDGAWELARLWISSERSFVATARQDQWRPELLGSLLVECARTAAASWAHSQHGQEGEVFRRICAAMQEEIARLSDEEQSHDH